VRVHVKRITATATATNRRFAPRLVALIACAICGCAEGTPPAPTFVVRDSAGIEIVESAEPVWREGAAWTLSPEPVLDVGRTDGEASYLLDRVMGVVRLDDGSVVVANMGDNTLRWFDARGSFMRSVGRTGGGPGEFAQILSLRRVGDQLYVGQFSQHPTQVFELDGTYVRPISITAVASASLQLVGPFEDGAQLFMTWPQGQRTEAAPSAEPMALYRVAADGATIDSLGTVPAAVYSTVMGRFRNPVVFGPSGTLAVHGDRFYYAFRDDYDVEVRDRDGRLLRRFRRAWTPVPVTEAQVARYRDGLLNMGGEGGTAISPRMLEQRRRILDESVYAERHPAHGVLLLDRAGRLWVERADPERTQRATAMNPTYDRPTDWDVFDERGAWLGVITTPAEMRVYEIGDDYVAGVWRDDVEVEHVRVYELRKN
jgi:hypothetical protein